MGGGTGLKYAASTIVYLSKKKVKEGNTMLVISFTVNFTKVA